MKENKNNVLLTIIGAATLLVAIVGASFAYFSATGGTASQDVQTGSLKISAVAGSIEEANIKPVADADITSIEEKLANNDVVKLPITVTTTGTNVSSEYNIFLTTTGIGLDESKTGGSLEQLKWELLQGEDGSEASIATGNFASGDVTKLQLNSTAFNIVNGGAVDNYKLLIYIQNTEDTPGEPGSGVQDKLQGMSFTAYTTVEAQQK